MRHKRSVDLTGHAIDSAESAVTMPDGSLMLLDSKHPSILHFDSQGKFINEIGAIGPDVGGYRIPEGITAIDDSLCVVDISVHRVTCFSMNGIVGSSFVYSRQRFSASQLAYVPKLKQVVLFGNRWDDRPRPTRSAQLLTIYNAIGDYQTSVLPMPEKYAKLGAFVSDQVFVSRNPGDGSSTFALPFSYTLYTLDQEGALGSLPVRAPATFKEPSQPFDMTDNKDVENRLDAWIASWTPIVAVWRKGGNTFFEYETWSPLRYTIDEWDSALKTVIRTIRTNYRYINACGDEDVYVQNTPNFTKHPALLIGDL